MVYKINSVNAIAGSGKTFTAVSDCIEQAHKYGRKFAYMLPSKELGDEVERQARNKTPKVKITRIDSDDYEYRVKSSIVEHLNHANEDEGEILIMTQNAGLTLPYWFKKENWHVITDEINPVLFDCSVNTAETFNFILDNVEFEPFNMSYVTAKPTENGKTLLKKIAENKKNDDCYRVFQQLACHLISEHHEVYMNIANVKLIKNKKTDGEKNKHQLNAYSYIKPSIYDGFASVTIMGAMFKESLLYLLWSQRENVKFSPHKRIQKNLRFLEHSNGSELTIEYMFDRAWSKNFRDGPKKDKEILNKIYDAVNKAMQHVKEYGVIKNKDLDLKDNLPKSVEIPVVCHGLNKFAYLNEIVYLCALNASPPMFTFAESLGINSKELKRAYYFQVLYQGIMRSSLRDSDNHQKKRIVVMDREVAEYIQSYFPNSEIKKNKDVPFIPVKQDGRPHVWKDDETRIKANNEKKRLIKQLEDMGETKASVSLFSSIYSKDYLIKEISSNRAFMDDLKKQINDEATEKKKNILICPSTFQKVKGVKTERGLENIKHVSGVWLDNDTGGMSPDEFRDMFPNLWFAAFSSYTSKGRYRIFIPTSQVMTPEIDQKIKLMILEKIKSHGWSLVDPRSNEEKNDKFIEKKLDNELHKLLKTKEINLHETPNIEGFRVKYEKEVNVAYARSLRSYGDRIWCGLDVSKINSASLFYLPCKRKGDENSFFKEYAGEELNPINWLENTTVANLFDPEPEYKPIELPVIEEPKDKTDKLALIRHQAAVNGKNNSIAKAIAKYHAVPIGAKSRNNAFFRLGLSLKYAGCNEIEISQHLHSAAQDKDRHDQVKSVINSLRKTKYQGQI